uniref:t-SNARE coiled-coil homology domain-containing protein n=1 Tax=Rhabditophanes sp. KR3021 TaxID=114890 RepID=A0AC35TSE7_9BILA
MANPFDDDSDMKIKSFSRSNNRGQADDISEIEREIERTLQESLDSSQRARANLENSEQLGIKTAQNLLEQREKLERADHNLDKIHHTTTMTQRNLNSLKSVFGGFFKNKFKSKPQEPIAQIKTSQTSESLNNTMDKMSSSQGFGYANQTGPSLSEQSRNQIKGTRFEEMDREIDSNLDSMSDSLAKLKNLGRAIGQEVEDQNRLLDTIQMKADKNDALVRHQDAQMKGLLGYKGVQAPTDSAGLVPKKR